MSVPASGAFRRSGGIISAITKQIKQINLKAVKRITVTFDPYHENVQSTRDYLFHLSIPKISSTNPNCALKTEIVCDRRPPSVAFLLNPAILNENNLKTIVFNSENLTTLELLELTNKHISTLAPKEEPVNVIKTKSEKKSAGGGAGGKVGKKK